MISPLAYIHPEAKIGENVEIAPFVFIDKNVVIGDNNKIMANANILYGSRIGNGNTIFPGAVIGAIPQDLKFRGEESTAEIGDNNLIRENVTINRGTAAKGRTIVGNNNLLMEGVHVAHDALVGNGCIIGNSTKMAGEIVIDDNAIVSANVLMHQFCHVGSHVMIQGGCRFSKDIPPYIIAGREPIAFSGINIIGLRRRGFSNEVIESIHNDIMIYRFTIISDEVDDFVREIQIDPEATFYDFHEAILKSVGYANDQMTSFFICDDDWEKGKEVTLEEMDDNPEIDSWVMKDTAISELVEDEKQKLLYVFDYITERCFFIELSEIITGKDMNGAKCTKKSGDAPKQTVDFEEMTAAGGSLDLDENFYGDQDFDMEDFDQEGFDIGGDTSSPYEEEKF